jgi:general stress protein 26
MDPQTERATAIGKLSRLIGEIRIAMLTTITAEGRLRSRPITTQKARFDGDLWFLTRLGSAKVREVRQHQQVNLSFASPKDNAYVSITGTAEVVDDAQKAAELWDPSYQSWFPGGPNDPELAVIRVNVERAEYWEAPAHTWPLEAGFVVLAPDQQDSIDRHAVVVLTKE